MRTKEDLIAIVKRANKKQLWNMIYDFDMIGFYREDKRQQRGYIIACLNNCYTTELNAYGIHDSDSVAMEKAIINAMK